MKTAREIAESYPGQILAGGLDHLTEVIQWAIENNEYIWTAEYEYDTGIDQWVDIRGTDDDDLESDCTPSFEGGYWTDPNDPTA